MAEKLLWTHSSEYILKRRDCWLLNEVTGKTVAQLKQEGADQYDRLLLFNCLCH